MSVLRTGETGLGKALITTGVGNVQTLNIKFHFVELEQALFIQTVNDEGSLMLSNLGETHLITVLFTEVIVQSLFSKSKITEILFPSNCDGKFVPLIVRVLPPNGLIQPSISARFGFESMVSLASINPSSQIITRSYSPATGLEGREQITFPG